MNLKALNRKKELLCIKHLYYIFYKNYKYRPKGFHTNIFEYLKENKSKDKLLYEIYPESISKFEISEEKLEASSRFVKYELEALESSKFVLKVKNGRILTDFFWTVAIFDERDKLIGDVSLDLFLKENETISDSRIFKRRYFPNVKHFNGNVFHTIAGGGSYINYGHWLLDSVSKIHILKESGLFEEVDWFYVPSIKFDYQLDSLLALGIPREKIIDSKMYPHISADEIYASSYSRGKHYHIPRWIINFFRNEFSAKGKPNFRSKKYFISREDSAIRNIVNEGEVSRFLAMYGIETITLSKLTFQEKIDLFAYADIIISMFGAGLTNFMFCKENTTVVEIFGDQFVDFTYYFDIATKCNLNYHYFLGENVSQVTNSTEGHHGDIVIDIDSLRVLLETKIGLQVHNSTSV